MVPGISAGLHLAGCKLCTRTRRTTYSCITEQYVVTADYMIPHHHRVTIIKASRELKSFRPERTLEMASGCPTLMNSAHHM